MPSLPRLRSACDACHQLKIKCSGTVPCNTCTDAGQACLYSMSNRRGRPPGAKNKRMLRVTPRPSNNTNSRSIEETGMSQHCLVLDRPALPQRQQLDSQAQQPGQEDASKQITPSDTFTPDSSSVGFQTCDNKKVEDQNDAIPYPSGRNTRRLVYDYSAMVGTWHWSSTDSESIVSNPLPEENMNPGSSTSVATDVLQLTNYDIPNTTSIVLLDQPPQSGAAQVPLGQPESARGSRSNTTFPRSQHSRQCFCFERNSSLLCMLKRAGSEEGQVPDTTSGRLMVRIQEALRAWNELSECSSCAHDNDTDVLLLALVCGRELVTQIQAEPGLYDNGPEPGHSPSLVLGNYEVKGDEKSMLLLALRSITIKKLERAILSLQEVLEKKKTLLRARKLASSSHQDRTGSAWDDFAHMDQMMQGIMGYLEILRSAE